MDSESSPTVAVVGPSKIPSFSTIGSRLPGAPSITPSQSKPRAVSILDTPIATTTDRCDVKKTGSDQSSTKKPYKGVPALNLTEIEPSGDDLLTPCSTAAHGKMPCTSSPATSGHSRGMVASMHRSPTSSTTAEGRIRKNIPSSPKIGVSPRLKVGKIAFGRAMASPASIRAAARVSAELALRSSARASNSTAESLAASHPSPKLESVAPAACSASASKARSAAAQSRVTQRSISVDKARPGSSIASRSTSVEKPRPVYAEAAAHARPMSVDKVRPGNALLLSKAVGSTVADRSVVPAAARGGRINPSPVRRSIMQHASADGRAVAAVKPLTAIPERTASMAAALRPAAPGVGLGTDSQQPAVTVTMAAAEVPAIKPTPPAVTNPRPRPPGLSLNLSSVKSNVTEPVVNGSSSSSSSVPGTSVPKLNLTPLIQQREEEQGTQAAYTVASGKSHDHSSKGSSTSLPEPADHFYYYPKLDSKDERQTMDMISHLPRSQASHMKNIFHTMVEAKQNCEAIAFRGHRLLDQLNSHMKEQLNKANEREGDLQRQLTEYQAKHEQQQERLSSLMMMLQGMQGLNKTGGMGEMSGLLSAIGFGPEGTRPQDQGAEGPESPPLGELGERASMLAQLHGLSLNMSSQMSSVSQMSSRLGGVAVPHSSLMAGAGGVGMMELLKNDVMMAKLALAVEPRVTDDCAPEVDVNV